MEELHYERGKAAFTLKDRLQKHRIAHPKDMPIHEPHDSDMLTLAEDDAEQDDIELFEVDDAGGVQIHTEPHPGSIGNVDAPEDSECEAKKSDTGNRNLKAQFGRRRTHYQQTLCRPCGVFHAHATMYGAEAVSNVLVCLSFLCTAHHILIHFLQLFVQAAFTPLAAHKPEHFVYDTNCDEKQQVNAHPEEWSWFSDMGMYVDVWHFHPADFPELMAPDGKWFFNTSVAEQTNVWLGGYHSMCREMLPVKFTFFLDEMIRLRNEIVVAQLKAEGADPRRAPPRTA
jgi:hypothetical protein